MVLLLQLNGDLPELFAGHERRLYVLTCRRKACRRKEGSIRALRGLRITEPVTTDKKKGTATKPEPQPPKPMVDIGGALFGGKAAPLAVAANPFSTTTTGKAVSNPFSTAPSASARNPFSRAPPLMQEPAPEPVVESAIHLSKTFASALSLNNDTPQFGPPPPPEPWPPEADLPPAYPLYYLADADYEILDKTEELAIPVQTMELDEGGGGGSQKEDKEVYESTIDHTFQKFADRLAQNPEQVIRYEFRGQPLLYSKNDAVGRMVSGAKEQHAKIATTTGSGNRIPRCGNCGSGRVFEVQLTPHSIMELEADEMSIDDGMEWGTVILGVCESDCLVKGARNVGYVEEWAGVQWEESR